MQTFGSEGILFMVLQITLTLPCILTDRALPGNTLVLYYSSRSLTTKETVIYSPDM